MARMKLSITEAAKRLGVSRYTLYRRVKEKEIPAVDDPLDKRQKLIDEEIINDLLERAGRPKKVAA
jgi:excisionase family DNA binding protein